MRLRCAGGEDPLLELGIHRQADPGPDLAHPAEPGLAAQHHLLPERHGVQGLERRHRVPHHHEPVRLQHQGGAGAEHLLEQHPLPLPEPHSHLHGQVKHEL